MLALVEKWNGQAGCHVYDDDRNTDNGSQQIERHGGSIHEAGPERSNQRHDHGEYNGDVGRAEVIDMRQCCRQCPNSSHSEKDATCCVDACVGVGESTIENGETDNELERSPHSCRHRCPGICVLGIPTNGVEAPTYHACVRTKDIKDANRDGCQQNCPWHSATRV